MTGDNAGDGAGDGRRGHRHLLVDAAIGGYLSDHPEAYGKNLRADGTGDVHLYDYFWEMRHDGSKARTATCTWSIRPARSP